MRARLEFSPDGRWVAYKSDKSGRDEVYVRAFIPPSASGSPIAGAEWPVSTAGGLQPEWRNDGKELYYRAPDGKLMAVDVTLGPAFHAGTPSALFPGASCQQQRRCLGCHRRRQTISLRRTAGAKRSRTVHDGIELAIRPEEIAFKTL